MFPPVPFDELNETDVREEVITPLLYHLGYRTGTRYNIVREQSLRYPRIFIGRKDPKRDPLLRGKVDYLLEVEGVVNWVIEAKAPSEEIGVDAIDQAWSYASHAEVRAVYFVLCNGRELHVHQTQHGPNAPAILKLSYVGISEKFPVLEGLLGPAGLLRAYPVQSVDLRQPLGPGLRSIARITSGLIRYEETTSAVRMLTEMQITVNGGAIERDENDRLVALVNTVAPFHSIQRTLEQLGLTSFELESDDKVLSIKEDRPTVFSSRLRAIFPQGQQMFDITTGVYHVLPFNLTCVADVRAIGVLVDHAFGGIIQLNVEFSEIPEGGFNNSGVFLLNLA